MLFVAIIVLVSAAVLPQSSAQWDRSRLAAALVYSRTNNPYLRAVALSQMRRQPYYIRGQGHGQTGGHGQFPDQSSPGESVGPYNPSSNSSNDPRTSGSSSDPRTSGRGSDPSTSGRSDDISSISASGSRPPKYRICPEEIKNSFYKFCSQSFCSAKRTRNSCCKINYTGKNGVMIQQCRCEQSIDCAEKKTKGQRQDPGQDRGQGQGRGRDQGNSQGRNQEKTQGQGQGKGRGRDQGQGRGHDNSEEQGQPGQSPQPRSLCDSKFQKRSLNSRPVQTRSLNSRPLQSEKERCPFGEVANITAIANGQVVTCNAVLTRANVKGVSKVTFLTSSLCKSQADVLANDLFTRLELNIGSQSVSLAPPISTVSGPNGLAFIELPDGSPVLTGLGQCEEPACAYNPDTMRGQVDMGDCKMLSYGASDPDTYKFDGLREVELKEKRGGCANPANNNFCFETKSGDDVYCLGDSGAPVYCKAPSTDEWILVGVTALQINCGGTSEVKVTPVPV